MGSKPVVNKVASFGKRLSAAVGELVAQGYLLGESESSCTDP